MRGEEILFEISLQHYNGNSISLYFHQFFTHFDWSFENFTKKHIKILQVWYFKISIDK